MSILYQINTSFSKDAMVQYASQHLFCCAESLRADLPLLKWGLKLERGNNVKKKLHPFSLSR